MQAFLMMDAVAFGPLKNVAEPMGRANVPMIDKLG
jgi:hypothetical protein